MQDLLGDGVEDLRLRRDLLPVTRSADGAGLRDDVTERDGPTIAVYRNIAADPDRVAALDGELADLGDRAIAASGTPGTMAWEYLFATATRAPAATR